jgi:hypothetical protein
MDARSRIDPDDGIGRAMSVRLLVGRSPAGAPHRAHHRVERRLARPVDLTSAAFFTSDAAAPSGWACDALGVARDRIDSPEYCSVYNYGVIGAIC